MQRRVVLTVGVALALGMAGCGKKAKEKAADEAASKIMSRAMSMASGKDAKVEVSGQTVKFTDDEGTLTVNAGKDAKLPDGFPDDLPLYKGASILHSASHGTDSFSVGLKTDDSAEDAVAFYKEAVAAKGWEIQTTMQMPNGAMLAVKKGDLNATIMVITGDDVEGTVINIACSRQ